MSVVFRMLILFSLALLSSCAYMKKNTYYSDRDQSYLTATSVPPLRIPPGVTSGDIESYYPIADKNYSEESKRVNITPPGLTLK
jgi:uncharacterized lipoprotein